MLRNFKKILNQIEITVSPHHRRQLKSETADPQNRENQHRSLEESRRRRTWRERSESAVDRYREKHRGRNRIGDDRLCRRRGVTEKREELEGLGNLVFRLE